MKPVPGLADLRPDLAVVAEWVAPGARVLDVGCGDGTLLAYLAGTRDVDGRGIELSQAGVNACVRRGLAVVQGDADTDLVDYPAASFDCVILSQTLQATRAPRAVLGQMLRIGACAIVSFPNFGHWRARAQLVLGGRMPVTPTLPAPWYETPNIHLCTIADFLDLCAVMEARVERGVALDRRGRARPIGDRGGLANLTGELAIFQLGAGRPSSRP